MAYRAEWYQQNRERILAKQAARYRADEAWRQQRKVYLREYYRKNQEKMKARALRRYHLKKEEIRVWQRSYYQANREYISARDREYRRTRPPDPRRTLERGQRWREANREHARQLVRNRRARKARAPGETSQEQLLARIAYYGGRCWMCRGSSNAIDHVIPLSRGGSNWPANLRPACGSCNSRKGNKRPSELVS